MQLRGAQAKPAGRRVKGRTIAASYTIRILEAEVVAGRAIMVVVTMSEQVHVEYDRSARMVCGRNKLCCGKNSG